MHRLACRIMTFRVKKTGNKPLKMKKAMEKKTMKFLSMAAVALFGAIISGCSNDDDAILDIPQQPEQQINTVTLTTTVSLDTDNATTRALTEGGEKTFAVGDQIAVGYRNSTSSSPNAKAVSLALTAADISADGKTATFTVTLTNPKPNSQVYYMYPASMMTEDCKANLDILNTQDGTLETIAANMDYSFYSGYLDDDYNLPDNATLENQLAIGVFTVKDSGTDITGSVTNLTVNVKDSFKDYTYSVVRTTNTGPIYVAMRSFSDSEVNFAAVVGESLYVKTVTGKTFAKSKMYPINLSTTKANPLTFKALYDGTIQVRSLNDDGLKYYNFLYTVNNGVRTQATANAFDIAVKAGDVVRFFAARPDAINGGEWGKHGIIRPSVNCYVYGNVMSLCDQWSYSSMTTIANDYQFWELFTGGTHIVNHPTLKIELPATTLSVKCYAEMFNSCTSLTSAPDLPATTLASGCYWNMFYNCTSLATAPELPATTLAESCYRVMFGNCTSLTTAPDLPAATLVDYCYKNMFYGCTSLNYIKCLATDISATECTYNWVTSVPAGGNFYKPTATDWSGKAENCGIPSGWTPVNQ